MPLDAIYDLPDPRSESNQQPAEHAELTRQVNKQSTPQALFSEDVILQHPGACLAAMNPEDTFSIIWDSGASMCITHDKRDFVNKIKPMDNAVVSGISSGLEIKGLGRVRWSVLDTNGKLRHLLLPAYYVPKTRQRLLSTSVFCKAYPKNPISISGNTWIVKSNPHDKRQSGIDIYINSLNNLPTSTSF